VVSKVTCLTVRGIRPRLFADGHAQANRALPRRRARPLRRCRRR
jgi:hypothetical protein